MRREVLSVYRDRNRIMVRVPDEIDPGTAVAIVEAVVPVLMGAASKVLREKAPRLGILTLHADDGNVMVILPTLYENPAVWGVVIAELPGHVANAYVERGLSPLQTKQAVEEMVRVEWARPTDKATMVDVLRLDTVEGDEPDENETLARYAGRLDAIRNLVLQSGLVGDEVIVQEADLEQAPYLLVKALIERCRRAEDPKDT